MSKIKFMLAEDYNPEVLKFPLIMQPKIDGVRGGNFNGDLTGRSLLKHDNLAMTAKFSGDRFVGCDGELIADVETHPDLCRLTSSLMSTVYGPDFGNWVLFDYIGDGSIDLPYGQRLDILTQRFHTGMYGPSVALIQSFKVDSLEDIDRLDKFFRLRGYEGSILRDPNGKYKQGRSTAISNGLLRIKRFTDAEGIVLAINEGQHNANAATTNELGKTKRSTHKANMVPNGMVGSLLVRDLKTQREGIIAAGCMVHQDRVKYFHRPDLIVGRVVKFQHFDHGVKDKLRFGTFQSLRAESDIGHD